MNKWDDEPNEVSFVDDSTKYPIELRRHPKSLHWCGYIGVPTAHPWYGKHYGDKVPVPADGSHLEATVDEVGIINVFCSIHDANSTEMDISLLVRTHGGITFAGAPYWEETRADWFFGFDCAHAGDLCPGHMKYGVFDGDVYRDLEYAKESARKAAADIARAASSAARLKSPQGDTDGAEQPGVGLTHKS